jgi:hypothetical protein
MRLTKSQEAVATQELLDILERHPNGLPTTQLSGTPRFHGTKTLRNPQIIRLLRKSGAATMTMVGGGKFWQGWWRLAKLSKTMKS